MKSPLSCKNGILESIIDVLRNKVVLFNITLIIESTSSNVSL